MSDAEPDTDVGGPLISRREALGYTTLLASAALLTGCSEPLAPATTTVEPIGDGFMFHHDESVWVIIAPSSQDRRKFDLTVRVEREDTEFFRDLNAQTVGDIVSSHITVAPFPIPT